MLLLALDTATPAVTVALHDGERLLAHFDHADARRHGELLLPAVDQVLRTADREIAQLTELVVGVGPGPYTGLRVGLATAEALGSALDVPVRGLCTLDAMAYASGLGGGPDGSPFLVATDARRKEVYWARYADPVTRLGEPAVARPEELAERVAGVPALGAGARMYPEVFTGVRHDLPEHQSAAALAALAVHRFAVGPDFLPPRPLYLRRPDARVPSNYKVVTPR